MNAIRNVWNQHKNVSTFRIPCFLFFFFPFHFSSILSCDVLDAFATLEIIIFFDKFSFWESQVEHFSFHNDKEKRARGCHKIYISSSPRDLWNYSEHLNENYNLRLLRTNAVGAITRHWPPWDNLQSIAIVWPRPERLMCLCSPCYMFLRFE